MVAWSFLSFFISFLPHYLLLLFLHASYFVWLQFRGKKRRVGWKRKCREKETTKHTTIAFFYDCLFFLLSSSWQTEPSNPYLYLKATKGRKKYSSKLLQQAFIVTKQKVGVKHSDGDDSRVKSSDIKNTEGKNHRDFRSLLSFPKKLCNVLQHVFFSRCLNRIL